MAISYNKIASIILTSAFFLMGLLIGTLLAFSAQSLSKGVIAALFALFGGSLLGLLQKLSITDQIKAGGGLGAIALGAMIGIYTGLYVNEYQLLTPLAQRVTSGRTPPVTTLTPQEKTIGPAAPPVKETAAQGKADKNPRTPVASSDSAASIQVRSDISAEGRTVPAKYLRANVLPAMDEIDQEYRNGLPPAEAYQRLRGVILAKAQ